MLGNQLIDVFLYCFLDLFDAAVILQNPFKNRIIYVFVNPQFLSANIHVICDVNHHIRENLNIAFFRLYHNIGHSRVLDLSGKHIGHLSSGCRNDLTRRFINHILRKHKACDTIAEVELFIKFISADLSQIISSCIKEHAVQEGFRILNCQRLARTKLFV